MKKLRETLLATSLIAIAWGASSNALFAQDERRGNVTAAEDGLAKLVEPSAAVKAAVSKFETALKAKDIENLGGLLFTEAEFAEYFKKQSGQPLDENTSQMFREKRMEIKAKCSELANEMLKVSLGECREKEGDHGIRATFAQVKLASTESQSVLNLVLIPYGSEMKLVMFDR